MREDVVKEYTNGEVTIIWKPGLCVHIAYCWRELPDVFDPRKRPWVNANGANTERIIQQVKRCPSGALSYYMNNKQDKSNDTKIDVIPNGPLVVAGNISIVKNGKGEHSTGAAFCRCGKSKTQPFCDGSHIENPFE